MKLVKISVSLGIFLINVAFLAGCVAQTPIVITVPVPATVIVTVLVKEVPTSKPTSESLPQLPRAKTATAIPTFTSVVALQTPKPSPLASSITPQIELSSLPSTPQQLPTITSTKSNLPKASTATPPPLIELITQITGDMASQIASEQSMSEGLPLQNIQIKFAGENIYLYADWPSNIPLKPSDKVIAVAQPIIENESLKFQVSSLTLNGTEMPSYKSLVSNALTNGFLRIFAGRRIKSAQITDLLTIVTLEPQQ